MNKQKLDFFGKFYNFPRKSFFHYIFKKTLLCLEWSPFMYRFTEILVYIKHNCQVTWWCISFYYMFIVSVLFWANWKQIERMILKLDEFKGIEITIRNHNLKLNEQQNKNQSNWLPSCQNWTNSNSRSTLWKMFDEKYKRPKIIAAMNIWLTIWMHLDSFTFVFFRVKWKCMVVYFYLMNNKINISI